MLSRVALGAEQHAITAVITVPNGIAVAVAGIVVTGGGRRAWAGRAPECCGIQLTAVAKHSRFGCQRAQAIIRHFSVGRWRLPPTCKATKLSIKRNKNRKIKKIDKKVKLKKKLPTSVHQLGNVFDEFFAAFFVERANAGKTLDLHGHQMCAVETVGVKRVDKVFVAVKSQPGDDFDCRPLLGMCLPGRQRRGFFRRRGKNAFLLMDVKEKKRGG